MDVILLFTAQIDVTVELLAVLQKNPKNKLENHEGGQRHGKTHREERGRKHLQTIFTVQMRRLTVVGGWSLAELLQSSCFFSHKDKHL